MQIGKVIRFYRKAKNMTQEEMAKRLGVTAPAVNKWENENSYPDITLLTPIARLLDISLDTLFSFQEQLTQEEITAIVLEADQKLKTASYAEVFLWAKSKIEAYPNCFPLIWQLAAILDAHRLIKNIPLCPDDNNYILCCFQRVLESGDESLRTQAADSLFTYYLRNEDYAAAEKYLNYFSIQNPNRKLKQAIIYSKTNRLEEAYQIYEQLLFCEYQLLSLILHHLFSLAMEENDFVKASLYAQKQQSAAKLFEMGTYHEIAGKLALATAQKDTDTISCSVIIEELLHSFESITDFTTSALYEHLNFKTADSDFLKYMKQQLQNSCSGFSYSGESLFPH